MRRCWQQRWPTPRRRLRAFSLVELVITIAVVGILAAIAVPRFARAQDGAALDAAARRVVAELTAIRERAIVSRTAATVSLAIGRGVMRVNGIETAGLSCAGGGFTIEDAPYGVTVGTVTWDSSAIAFDAFGASESGKFTIVRDRQSRTIFVEATGAVRWE